MVIPRRVIQKEVMLGLLLSIVVLLLGFGLSAGAPPENGLSRAGGEIQGEVGRELIAITWKWQHTLYDNGTKVIVSNPDHYTLKLLPDGKVDIRGDCNVGGGSYLLKDGTISIEITHSTLAACPPESLDQSYIRDLNTASGYFLEGDSLYIDLKYGTGTMKFLR